MTGLNQQQHLTMENWFSQSLFPKMLEIEEQVKRAKFRNSNMETFIHKERSHPDSKSAIRENSTRNHRKRKCRKSSSSSVDELPQTCSEFEKFKQENLKHQENLQKKKEMEDTVEYIMDTEGPQRLPRPSSDAPERHAEAERMDRLQELYGSNANTIEAIEMKLQSKFDHKVSSTNPPFWPIIPFKV